ncbi:MAG: virion core protein, T7 gp14 family [Telluria sp.]
MYTPVRPTAADHRFPRAGRRHRRLSVRDACGSVHTCAVKGDLSMGVGASAAGAIMSAGSAYQQAQAQRASLRYQGAVDRMNAGLAGDQASDAIRNGQTAEGVQDLRTAQVTGTQRAQMAANGVDLGEGSPNDVLATTKYMGTRDALQIHDNAMMQAWGYRTQQSSFLLDANRAEGEADTISPWMAAGTSLLTGASRVSASWDAKAKANGTPDFGTTVKTKLSNMWGS